MDAYIISQSFFIRWIIDRVNALFGGFPVKVIYGALELAWHS